MKRILQIGALLGICVACSKVESDSGRNADPRALPQDNPSQEIEPGLTGNGPQSKKDTSCFGGQEKLPSFLQDFCSYVTDEDRENYKTTLNLMCDKKELNNLFHPSCGAREVAEIEKNFKILKTTDLADKSTTDFYYLSANALMLEDKSGDPQTHYVEVIKLAYTDPETFKKTYRYPKNTKLTPDGNGVQDLGNNRYLMGFSIEVNTLVKTSFQGTLEIIDFGEGFTAILSRAVDKLEGLNFRNNVTLIYRPDGQSEKVISIEERSVPDRGLHNVAYNTLRDLDIEEMTMRLENRDNALEGGVE